MQEVFTKKNKKTFFQKSIDTRIDLWYTLITVREEQKQPAGASSEAQTAGKGGKLRAVRPRSGVQLLSSRTKAVSLQEPWVQVPPSVDELVKSLGVKGYGLFVV